jgi:hypothetical protein
MHNCHVLLVQLVEGACSSLRTKQYRTGVSRRSRSWSKRDYSSSVFKRSVGGIKESDHS